MYHINEFYKQQSSKQLKIDEKINLHYCDVVCGFKMFETIDEEEISDLL